MISEQIEFFLDELVRKTDRNELDWRPLATLKEWDSIIWKNDYSKRGMRREAVQISKSFFLRSGEGYVFLLDILNDNSDKSFATEGRIALLVKIDDVLPVDDLSDYYIEEYEKLLSLQTLIEKHFEQKYSYPNVLYDFLKQVICDGKEKKD